LIAWIIGWDLLLEYAIGNIAIAIAWSDYFTGFLSGLGIHIPEYMTMDFLTALRGHNAVEALLAKGQTLAQIFADHSESKDAYRAWMSAPVLGRIHFIADVPALLITVSVTALIYVGIKESRNANNIMVAVKLIVILAVISIGFFYVNPQNWSPFMPNGLTGVLKGVARGFLGVHWIRCHFHNRRRVRKFPARFAKRNFLCPHYLHDSLCAHVLRAHCGNHQLDAIFELARRGLVDLFPLQPRVQQTQPGIRFLQIAVSVGARRSPPSLSAFHPARWRLCILRMLSAV